MNAPLVRHAKQDQASRKLDETLIIDSNLIVFINQAQRKFLQTLHRNDIAVQLGVGGYGSEVLVLKSRLQRLGPVDKVHSNRRQFEFGMNCLFGVTNRENLTIGSG